MSLVTRCPKCNSDFVVKLEQLQALDGLVRCGTCAHIFDGFATLQSQLPTLTQRPGDEPLAEVNRQTTEPSVLRHRAERTAPYRTGEPTVAPPPPSPPPPAPAPAMTPVPPQRFSFTSQPTEHEDERAEMTILGESRLREEGSSVGRTQPEFMVDEFDTPRLKILLWGLGSALALALLVVQLAYVFRNDFASQLPVLRPALDSLCAKLKCDISLRRHLERISVSVIAFERQSVAEQESKPAEMSLKFSIRNRFNQAQPWPDLSLALTDASGTVVLRKRITPKEYLPAALVDRPFAASQEVSLVLPVTVTGLQINGYTLKPFFP